MPCRVTRAAAWGTEPLRLDRVINDKVGFLFSAQVDTRVTQHRKACSSFRAINGLFRQNAQFRRHIGHF
jgi:hypothetical protein